jgi:protein-L-isoaspartate(D-aspartate) O-methyltransferase
LPRDAGAYGPHAGGLAGYEQVEVLCSDGAAGAPYDRIVVTAEAWDISAAWWKQLAPGGRIVLPWRLHGSGLTRSLALDLDPSGRMVSRYVRVCGFVPFPVKSLCSGFSAAEAA